MKQRKHQGSDERFRDQVANGGDQVAGNQTDRLSTIEDMMYWRKANHIHGWFVDNVQGSNDDQKEYYLDWGKLRALHSVCDRVLNASKLVDGEVYGGTVHNQEYPDGITVRESGRVLKDTAVAEKLLPTRTGLFFGSTEYDEHYLDEVLRTRNWAARMLADKKAGVPGDIYYSSSW